MNILRCKDQGLSIKMINNPLQEFSVGFSLKYSEISIADITLRLKNYRTLVICNNLIIGG